MKSITLVKFLKECKDDQIFLDLGCGKGENCHLIRSIHPNAKIFGVDIADEDIVPDYIEYKKVDLEQENLPYEDETMDVILLTHVLEHLTKYYNLANEIKRVLKKDGLLYLEAPNWTSTLLPSFNIKRHKHGPINFYDDPTHIKPWSQHGLYEYLCMSGVQCKKIGSVRNWWKLPYDPIKFIYNFIIRDRGRVSTALGNMIGWSVYAWGRKS